MPRTYLFLIDGTLSRLGVGEEANADLTHKLLQEMPEVNIGYGPAMRGQGFRKWMNVLTGSGINGSIQRGNWARLTGCPEALAAALS